MSTRTRSEVKWLVNEAAALAGEIERLDTLTAELSSKRETVQKAQEACTTTLAYVTKRRKETLGLPRVLPQRAHFGWGSLRVFLSATLRSSVGCVLTTAQLAERAIQHFELEFTCARERYDFRNNSVARALNKLKAAGLVERVAAAGEDKRVPTGWRWIDLTCPADVLEELTSPKEADACDEQTMI